MSFLLWHYLRDSAMIHPSRPAVASRGTVLTYRELDEQSNRLARFLSAKKIGRNSRVGVYMPKSEKSVVAILSVGKSGAAYVPVDPNGPPSRASYILSDCNVRGLITTTRLLRALGDSLTAIPSLDVIVLIDDEGELDETAPDIGISMHDWAQIQQLDTAGSDPETGIESDPAYLLYTSGSTGSPKGVILSHRHALTFVEWCASTFDANANDRLSNHAPLHFDLSVLDIYLALRSGACVVLVPDEIALFPVELAQWIESEAITIWYSVPSALTRLLLHGRLDRFEYTRLRTILFAGEVFPVKYLREVMGHFRHSEFFNLYGPTETNVCTYYKVPRPLPPDLDSIPIGKACENSDVFVLDEDGKEVALEQSGELHVRGPLVMLGYWGLPEKSREMLVQNRLEPAYEERLYRTGDIVRLESDGNYTFIGRRDHMVKSRGYRIELGEIENTLYQHEGIKEAVVFAIPDDEIGARLSAVVVLHSDDTLSETELSSFCTARLPKYMVPERFVIEREIPKTSTGKMDRVTLARSFASVE